MQSNFNANLCAGAVGIPMGSAANDLKYNNYI